MLAEDRPPASRLARAKAYLEELTDTLQRRGGNRLGLVVFAGKAKVLCPLTEDYDHFRFALELAHPDRLGATGRLGYTDDGTSYGTSLRQALHLAAAVHDPRFPGFQEILLISDGDDLAGDWHEGIAAARAAGIPVHTLGVGDPDQDAFIPTGRSDEPYSLFLNAEQQLQKITTRRRDGVLQKLAEETRGSYQAEENAPQPLLEWFQAHIAHLPARAWAEDHRPLRLHQYSWFFAGGLGLLVVELMVGDRRQRKPVG
jgi:Ca-activated chloride channel family protein